MASKDEVQAFLNDFKVKASIFGIIYRNDRGKNTQALLDLEISQLKRKEIIDSIQVCDYAEGPLEDTLNHIVDMWVFGKQHKDQEIYIKISMGRQDDLAICISFHAAERPMQFPLKITTNEKSKHR